MSASKETAKRAHRRGFCPQCTCATCRKVYGRSKDEWGQFEPDSSAKSQEETERSHERIALAMRKLFRRYEVISHEEELDDRGPTPEPELVSNWMPTVDHWIELALIMAIANKEPGFSVAPFFDSPRNNEAWTQTEAHKKWEINSAMKEKLEQGIKKAPAARQVLAERVKSGVYNPESAEAFEKYSLSCAKHYQEPDFLPPLADALQYSSDVMKEIRCVAEALTNWQARKPSRWRALADWGKARG